MRTYLVGIAAVVTIAATMPVVAQPFEGLAAYYKFDGDATDSSGNGRDAILSDASVADGVFGKCYRFTGQRIEIPVPFSGDHSNFTVEMWVNVETPPSSHVPFFYHHSFQVDGEPQTFALYISGEPTSYGFLNLSRYTTPETVEDHEVGSLDIGTWQHVAMTYSRSSLRLYIDGQLEADVIPVGTEYLWTGMQGDGDAGDDEVLYIGSGRPGTDPIFNGKIDEVRIWDHVRTQEQIKTFMHRTLGAPEFEIIDVGFTAEILYALNRQISSFGNNVVAGVDNDIVVVESRSDLCDYLVWYAGESVSDVARTGVNVGIRGIVPGGPNALLAVVENMNDGTWKVYKVTGPFDPVAVKGFAKY